MNWENNIKILKELYHDPVIDELLFRKLFGQASVPQVYMIRRTGTIVLSYSLVDGRGANINVCEDARGHTCRFIYRGDVEHIGDL